MKRVLSRTCASLALAAMASAGAGAVYAQSVGQPQPSAQSGGAINPAPPPAPQTVKAKYEGGVLGYAKAEGTLNFDDANRRLLFRDKQGKGIFSIPYDAVLSAFADTRARRPGAATVVGSIPLPYGVNIPALFVRKKYRYLTMQYRDPDTRAEGLTSFKVGSKELLTSLLHTLGQKAGLTQRGDAYVRRTVTSSGLNPTTSTPVPRP